MRLSGTGAFAVAARVVDGFRPEPHRQARLALFLSPDGSPIDRGIYLTFPGPHSYTGEDVVEFSCHGGLLTPARLLAALHESGARAAAPGEFTRRAVLNGKLDLLQAEAVGDLIDAGAPAQSRAALRQLEGGLSRRLLALRERLIELMAVMGYEVDFPEEDDAPVSRTQIARLLEGARQDVAVLLATAPTGERLREGALVVFAGRPNAGKSSLFNALLGVDRALVTEVPGTTRDTIEAATSMDGWPVRLADTAGLWDAPDRVDQLGMAVSRKYLGAADLVVLCVEATRSPEPDELAIRSEHQTVVARTKGDLSDGHSVGPLEDEVVVSAITAQGLDALRSLVARKLFGAGQGGYAELEPILTQERHRVALSRADTELAEAGTHLSPAGDVVLAAHHLRMAVTALDELVGAVDTEDVLDRIFSRFCVGK